MSKHIPGSIDNVYKDIEGNDCSLYQLVTKSPEWACSRIREGEKAAANLAALQEAAKRAKVLLDDATYHDGRYDQHTSAEWQKEACAVAALLQEQ